MPTTITIRATADYHERFPPVGAKRPYLARIIGRDPKMTFRLEFLAQESEFDCVRCPALLERRNIDKKGRPDPNDYILLYSRDDQVYQTDITKQDAMWLAAQLDARRTLDSCWDHDSNERITVKEAQKIELGVTVETAVERCWEILKVLPEKQLKKVMSQLKAKMSPPKQEETT